MDLSVIIPVYRSRNTLKPLMQRLRQVLDEAGIDYEVVFVNDDSPDDSWAVLCELHREHGDRLRAVRLTRNFGQHNAIMCGFHHARGRLMLTMDDDLQHPPEEIPKLLAAIERDELDVVYGRYDQKRHVPWRNFGSWALNFVYKRVFQLSSDFTAFRLIRREIVESVLRYQLNFTFIDGLLAWNTNKIGSVLVAHAERSHGRSGYSLRKLLLLSLNLLTNFSLFPLQAATIIGIAASACGLVAGVWYLVLALLGKIAYPGYASTITAILFLGGAQLLALGVIGEYVGRLHLNMNRKPQYLEREVLGLSLDREPPSWLSANRARGALTSARVSTGVDADR